ncbi:MAG: SDR family oxidoreductase [Deferribacteres bacterium]|nr:SDR family oxidoreductase [Deferribacteres bacterium]
MGKIIGLTGATGVIGKLLHEKLLDRGDIVKCFQHDIRDKNAVADWIGTGRFDCIIHLAALVPVIEVETTPFKAFSVNVGGTVSLLSAVSTMNDVPWIFYSSTSHVYKSSSKPISEEGEIEPINLYGKTKYYAEEAIRCFSKEHKSAVCIGRIFSFYHKTQHKPFLYPAIKERLSKENLAKPFYLKGARDIRDFLMAEDVAERIIDLMDAKYDGIINIASGKGITIEDFVQSMTDVDLKIITDKIEANSYLVADVTKLRTVREKQFERDE